MKVFGRNPVTEALKNENISINKIYIQNSLGGKEIEQIIALSKNRGLRVNYVPEAAIFKECNSKNHQGVLVDAVEFQYSNLGDVLANIKTKTECLIVVCDEISDPHNLGAIIRTSECAGADAVVISKDRSCLVNDTVLKTSAGAAFNINVVKVNNLAEAINEIKNNNIFVYGLEANGSSLYKTNLKGKVAIVVGSEGFGLRALTKKTCDEILSIPQFGKVNSLNASVAAAVSIYEVIRQRKN